jgi:predicted aspartyl protease
MRMALDTGATKTLINVAHLVSLGYEPSNESNRVQVTTGSGIEFAPLVKLQRVMALGQERTDLPVLAHTLPPTTGIDGLLGLDFLRERLLEIDFRKGRLSLS